MDIDIEVNSFQPDVNDDSELDEDITIDKEQLEYEANPEKFKIIVIWN